MKDMSTASYSFIDVNEKNAKSANRTEKNEDYAKISINRSKVVMLCTNTHHIYEAIWFDWKSLAKAHAKRGICFHCKHNANRQKAHKYTAKEIMCEQSQ